VRMSHLLYTLLLFCVSTVHAEPVRGHTTYNPYAGGPTWGGGGAHPGHPGAPYGGPAGDPGINDLARKEQERLNNEAAQKKATEQSKADAHQRQMDENTKKRNDWIEKTNKTADGVAHIVSTLQKSGLSNDQIIQQIVDPLQMRTDLGEVDGYRHKSPASQFRKENEWLHYRLYKVWKIHPALKHPFDPMPSVVLARKIGLEATEYADVTYAQGNTEEATLYHEIGKMGLELAVGLNPVSSIGTSLYEFIVGKSWLTQQDLTTTERTLAFLNIATFGGARYLKIAGKLRAVFKFPNWTNHLAKRAPLEKALDTALKESEQIMASSGKVFPKWSKKHRITHLEDAKAANTRLGYDKPPYLEGSHVVHFETTAEQTFVRLSNEANKEGTWLVRKGEIYGLTPSQIQDKLNLPKPPTHFGEVVVPSGTKMSRGITNANHFEGLENVVGGNVQYRLESKYQPSWFKDRTPLGKEYK
jgi:hypothetical protein